MNTNEQLKELIFDAMMALNDAHLYLRVAENISRKHGGDALIGDPLIEALYRFEGDDSIPYLISKIKTNLSNK